MAHGPNPVKNDFFTFFKVKKIEIEKEERKMFDRDQTWPAKPKNIYQCSSQKKPSNLWSRNIELKD